MHLRLGQYLAAIRSGAMHYILNGFNEAIENTIKTANLYRYLCLEHLNQQIQTTDPLLYLGHRMNILCGLVSQVCSQHQVEDDFYPTPITSRINQSTPGQ